MKVQDIINRYDADRPNQVNSDSKLRWLKAFEDQIIREVINTHSDFKYPEGDAAYDDNSDGWYVKGTTLYIVNKPLQEELSDHINDFCLDTELIIPDAYADCYQFYLDQKIAYNNGDIKRYNTASTAFNNSYITYQQYFNREHKPLPAKGYLFRHENL